jgi:signal transduction histidine kinase
MKRLCETKLSSHGVSIVLLVAGFLGGVLGFAQALSEEPGGWDASTLWSPALSVVVIVAAIVIYRRERDRRIRLESLLRETLSLSAARGDAFYDEARKRLDDVAHAQARAYGQLRATAAQDERNRIARDLHDTIKQQLFAIKMAAATAQTVANRDPDGAMRHVEQVASLADQAQVEMNALLTQLKPKPLATVGLAQAIGDQLEALHFRSDVQTELRGAFPDELKLPPDSQEAIFRIVQESLSNVARHARASRVRIDISHDERAIKVVVADDGQGFESSRAFAGMGLGNMRIRAREMGGDLTIDSKPNDGTRLTLRMPLQLPVAAPVDEQRLARAKTYYELVYSFVAVIAAPLLLTWLLGQSYFAGLIGHADANVWTLVPGIMMPIAIAISLGGIWNTRRKYRQLRALCGPGWDGSPWRRLTHVQVVAVIATIFMALASIALAYGALSSGALFSAITVALLVRYYSVEIELGRTVREWGARWFDERFVADSKPALFVSVVVLVPRVVLTIVRVIERAALSPQANGLPGLPPIEDATVVFLLFATITAVVPGFLLYRWRLRRWQETV